MSSGIYAIYWPNHSVSLCFGTLPDVIEDGDEFGNMNGGCPIRIFKLRQRNLLMHTYRAGAKVSECSDMVFDAIHSLREKVVLKKKKANWTEIGPQTIEKARMAVNPNNYPDRN